MRNGPRLAANWTQLWKQQQNRATPTRPAALSNGYYFYYFYPQFPLSLFLHMLETEDVVSRMTSENKNGFLYSYTSLHTKAKQLLAGPYMCLSAPPFCQTCQRKRQNSATRAGAAFKAMAVVRSSDIFSLSDLLLIAGTAPLRQLWGKCLANGTGRNQQELNP